MRLNIPSTVRAVALPLQVPPNCDLTLGMVCIDKSRPGRTVWRVEAHERFANPLGVLQGGFAAACCDSAMGAAALTYAQHRPDRSVATAEAGTADASAAEAGTAAASTSGSTPRVPLRIANVEMKVSFFRPVTVGSMLTCEAEVVSGGARIAFLKATLRSEDGTPLARATSTYLISHNAARS